MPCHYDPEKYYSRYPSSPCQYMFSPFLDISSTLLDITQTGRGFSSPVWSHLLPWSSSTQRSSSESGAWHFGCAAFVLFSRYFALNRTSSFLWYFVTPLINIDTADFLSLGALTYSSFHPNGMSNSPMNERNNSLPSEFNSNKTTDRTQPYLCHSIIWFPCKFFVQSLWVYGICSQSKFSQYFSMKSSSYFILISFQSCWNELHDHFV